MNDRFRFRFNAIVTVEYYENYENYENDEESKLQIYLRNIDLMDANTIGYRNDKISYILKNAGLSDYALHNAMERIEENSVSAEPSEWITLVPDVILLCTGRKDKNGTPIYEGDIIKGAFDDGTLTVIRWSKKDLTWCADFSQVYGKAEYSYYVALADYDSKNLEVIGNVYENPELFSVRNEE